MTGYESKKKAASAKTIDEVNWVDHELDGLAQPAQEPLCYASINKQGDVCSTLKQRDSWRTVPLYTAPPQRPWVGLTDEEFQLIYDMGRTPTGMMEMVEAKLKDKNNG